MYWSLRDPGRTARVGLFIILMAMALALLFAPPASEAAPPAGVRWRGVGAGPIEAFGRLSFDPPVWWANVRSNTDATGNGQHEPGLAVSPANPNVVVVANKDYRTGNIKRVWIEASRDGGQTWPTQLHMPGLPATENESDPVVMARDDGRIYVACLTTGNYGLFITWSDDDGVTWRPSVPIVQNQPGLQDKEWFAIDNNPSSPYYHRMYMAWAPGGTGGVASSFSTDGGLTWSPPQQIPNSGSEALEYPYPVVAQNGDVFLFHMYDWNARHPDPSILKVVKSTNGGVSWSAPANVATVYQPPSPPRSGDNWRFYAIISAAADPTRNEHLFAAWTDHRNYNTNGIEVMYSASTDHGAAWGPPTRLSHDPTGVVRDHITPMLDFSEDGRLHAMWLDRRMDPANRLFQAWYTSSTDGGETWEADSRVSDAPGLGFDLNVGLPPGSGNAAGDYWGLDAAGGYVYAAWTDTRRGEQDIYTSKGVRAAGSATVIATSTRTPTPVVTATHTPTLVITSTATYTPTSANTPTATPICTPQWRLVDSPSADPGSLVLYAVDAVSANDVWAVGYRSPQGSTDQSSLVEHWDGTAWTIMPSPNVTGTTSNPLNAVVAVAANDVWAVGYSYQGSNSTRTFTLHWDGSAWSIVTSPNAGTGNNFLDGVDAASAGDVWAVGHSIDASGVSDALAMRWDGSQWTIVPTVDVGVDGTYFYGVEARAANDVWAVGYRSQASPALQRTLIERWDGAAWAVVSSPSIGTRINYLWDVAVASAGDVWAVGHYGNSTSVYSTLVLRWDGAAWAVVNSPNGGQQHNRLEVVSAIAANDVWAIGYENDVGYHSRTVALHWDGLQWSRVTSPDPGEDNNALFGGVAVSAGDVWAVGAYRGTYPPRGLTLRYVGCPTPIPTASATRTYTRTPTDTRTRTVTHTPTATHTRPPTGTPTLTVTPCAMNFTDVRPTDYFHEAVRYLYCMGAVSGYGDDTFRPYNNTTRGQLCKIVVLAEGWPLLDPETATFSDVPRGSTFYQFVETAFDHDIISGYACGTGCLEFRPGNDVTRGQLCKIVALAHGWTCGPSPCDPYFTDVPTGSTFFEFIMALYNYGVVSGYGDGTFRPGNPATRGQICKIVYEAVTFR